MEAIDRLLKAGAKVDQPMNGGATPLWIASYKGHVEVIEHLLKAGADLAIQVLGKDALSLAKEKNHPKVVTLIEAEIARRKALAEQSRAPVEKPLATLTLEDPPSASKSQRHYRRFGLFTCSKHYPS